MDILTIALSALLGLGFLGAGVGKLLNAQQVTEILTRLGVGRNFRLAIGAAEALGGIAVFAGIWLQPLGIVAAIGLIITMIGAITFHLKAGDGAKDTSSSAILLVLSAIVLAVQIVTL